MRLRELLSNRHGSYEQRTGIDLTETTTGDFRSVISGSGAKTTECVAAEAVPVDEDADTAEVPGTAINHNSTMEIVDDTLLRAQEIFLGVVTAADDEIGW